MRRFLTTMLMVVVLSAVAAASGSGKKMLSNKEVKALVEKASTPADHTRLAEYYQAKAEKLEAESKQHAEMANMYRAHPTASEVKRPGAPDTATHCESLATNLAKAATEARALSSAQAEMAKK